MQRQRIADDSGATPEQVGRLLDHYFMVRAEYLRIEALGFWGRLKLLVGWTRPRGGWRLRRHGSRT